MGNLRDRLIQISYLLLVLVWLLIAAGFIGYAFGFFPNYDIQAFLSGRAGTLLLYGIGALAGFTGLYFFRKLIVSYRIHRTFVHESDFGDIHISHYAVKELTSEILRQDLSLNSFRTKLTQSTDGISIEVNAKVGSKADIGELGEKVQKVLREKIHERTGLDVGRVDFYTRGVEGPKKEDLKREPEESGSEDIIFEGDNDEN